MVAVLSKMHIFLEESTMKTSLILFVSMPKEDASSSPKDNTSKSFENPKESIEAITIRATAGISRGKDTEENPPTLKSPLIAVSLG